MMFHKPAKGEAFLASKKRRAERVAHERGIMDQVKRLDRTCRYPHCEHMAKKPRLEVAHVRHRGMGGNPTGDRTTAAELITYCFIHHDEYDHGTMYHEPLTPRGTRGPCAFYRIHQETGEKIHVASERETR